MLWVHVDDLDAHFAHASANGASIVSGVHQRGYRAYVAEGLEWAPGRLLDWVTGAVAAILPPLIDRSSK
jgi:hypothetical protein